MVVRDTFLLIDGFAFGWSKLFVYVIHCVYAKVGKVRQVQESEEGEEGFDQVDDSVGPKGRWWRCSKF